METFKIYLIEDNDDHAELIHAALQKFEQAELLHRSADGEEVLTLLDKIASGQAQKPDIILLDINLPKISGLQLLKIMKENQNLRHIPVIALTTSNSEKDKKEAYANHVNAYLVKPGDYFELQELLKSMIDFWGKFNCV